MNSQDIGGPFVKSSYSGGGSANECVEVARTASGGHAVRDSKNRDGGIQFYRAGEWVAFVAGVKAGEL
ncbi:DUF397 domain-containing protein [Streptomyces dysideae]|uniref:DUF397 domain-containing protein n=1 Tax=Streptomyces dysideae TaxID=909626 RepID=A0A117S1R1_9ACTN|nr:DUF397 domain-containing protein [Streptomyces dysideae]KUO22012.1 hypothetical protein AQJ91_05295 [Streptomyces dysideae]